MLSIDTCKWLEHFFVYTLRLRIIEGGGIVGGRGGGLETLVYINNRGGWNSRGGWKL